MITTNTENRVAVVCECDAANAVEDHLEHGAGPKTGADDIGERLGRGDVVHLGLVARLTFGSGVCSKKERWREKDNVWGCRVVYERDGGSKKKERKKERKRAQATNSEQ